MLYFIYGDSEKEIEAEKIIKTAKEANPGIMETIFDFGQKEAEGFLERVRQNSMFAPKELIIGRRAESIKNFDEFVDIMAIYDISAKEVIIEYNDSESKIKAATLKKIKGYAQFLEVRSDGKNGKLIEYIIQNSNMSEIDAAKLIEMAGTDFHKIKNEVEKLKSFFAGEKIDIEKAEKIISKSHEYKIYEVISALMAGNIREGYDYLDTTGNYMLLLYSAVRELQILSKIKVILEEKNIKFINNYNLYSKEIYPEIKSEIPGHPFAVFKKIEQAVKIDEEKLITLIKMGVDAELRIKKGIMDEDSAIKLFIAGFGK